MNEAKDLPRSLADLGAAFRERLLSPVEVVETLLERIEAVDRELNSFVTVLADEALEEAARVEKEILAGEYKGPLHGVPVGVKDLIYTRGVRTTMGSAFFEDHVPTEDATVVRKLKESGAILVGKTNTHEFAYGPTGDRSHFGPTRNPYDPSKISGGSSSGSAAAVAAGLCYAALGSDTAGSVRIPSALCATVGMKPTFGRVSKNGVFPLSWSLDHVGPITRSVADNALLLTALAEYDPKDSHSANKLPGDFARDLGRDVEGGRVGVPTGFYLEHVETEVEERVREAVEALGSLGAEVVEVEISDLPEMLRAQRLVLSAEAYAIHEERLQSEPEKFDEELLRYLLDSERLKAHRYARAQQITKRRSLREFERALEEVDVLLTPTVPIVAPGVGEREANIGGHEEPVFSVLTRLTGPTNFNGLPSLSIPCGFTSSGLPVGLQLVGRSFDEATIYKYAHAYETATGKGHATS